MNSTKQSQERQVDFCWWLARHGFSSQDLERPIAQRTTALMHAARHGASEIVGELLRRGVAVGACNADGNNALWFACFAGDLLTLDLLCDAGIDIDHRNDAGVTCLMYAASAGKNAVVERLLAHGADPSLRSAEDYTALDLCSTLECLRALRQWPAVRESGRRGEQRAQQRLGV